MQDLLKYAPEYPSVRDLKNRAKRRIPKFAFDYLEGGCNEEVNLLKNESDFHKIELRPQYLKDFNDVNMRTTLFGREYDAPFGISPIGLQGLMWPNAPEILAKAALRHNVPFILSTVSTSSIERIAEITESNFWFQLYHPVENALRDDILDRLTSVNCPVLTLLADVPSFGFRYREIKAGLSMPPRMTLRNIFQAFGRPVWSLETLKTGIPEFATLKKYMDNKMDMSQLGKFMNKTFNGRINSEKIAAIRDKWKGKLVVKGIVSEEDIQKCIALGADGIIVSNHGGRQIDAGESSIRSLQCLAGKYGDQITVMMDGGVRSGPDIARAIASGASFTFMGRPFMYGVAALGNNGGNHTIAMFKSQLKQVMEQLCCEKIDDLKATLVPVGSGAYELGPHN
ncbi:L-lactate dehydrogenase (cytochrome) [Anseongella ginsenosidimutans]|uniref:L-lactate dehydrogenase (Cytochrome) n=1 Tax=Anseongella ginsenosidimutans TaxID=496056 RepID=A0A4R3KVM7_9SPHI|nr:alpha-hydroxy acid oxidase [Anseongella ginsenosidimutans]QEC53526.1 alpha-hydroxy-acid oxidizing protein [Anseongella ginsenosidimutans]TCS88429.1 L-lactate dehydrogenase (cytochrome) [Anseongella ginsenosidimutans]